MLSVLPVLQGFAVLPEAPLLHGGLEALLRAAPSLFAFDPGTGTLGLLQEVVESLPDDTASAARLWGWVKTWVVETVRENSYVVVMGLFALVRAMGVTVQSGTTGLRFSFGRAGGLCQPGFHFKVPFLQKIEVVPTRSRTIDLPAQKVATFDSLVYLVDVNLVYRIADVRKAIIEVDELGKAMLQMLGVSVQEVLRVRSRGDLRVSDELDRSLSAAMEGRLAAWGVVVEHAGFTSIRPSPKTLLLTQLDLTAQEKRRTLAKLEADGLSRARGLPMLGSAQFWTRRLVRARRAEAEASRLRRRRSLVFQGSLETILPDPRLRRRVVRRVLTAPLAPDLARARGRRSEPVGESGGAQEAREPRTS